MVFSEWSLKRKFFICAVVPILVFLLSLFFICLVNTLNSSDVSKNHTLNEICSFMKIDRNDSEAVQRFSKSLTFPTVSFSDHSTVNTSAFLEYHSFLNRSYPGVFQSNLTTVEKVNNLSLLITIQGSLPDSPPYFLISHLDVVPADASKWSNCDPFSGQIEDDWICGRGAIDAKVTHIAILEALNGYLEQGYSPKFSIILVFGHDEETGGKYGAREVSNLLMERNIKPMFILDEGTGVFERVFPGLDNPLAALGVSEKGFLSLKMKAKALRGNSIIPPFDSAIGKLSKAITNLALDSQRSWFGYGPETVLLKNIAPFVSFGYRFMLSNLWLFSPLVNRIILNNEKLRTLVQTTTYFVHIEGGFKGSAIPGEASATVNHRVHPLDSFEDVLEMNRLAVADDSIEFKIMKRRASSRETPYDENGWAYHLLAATARQTFGLHVIDTPILLFGGTDSKHFARFTQHIIRFTPAMLDEASIASVHGFDEGMSVPNFLRAIKFYENLISVVDCEAYSSKG